MKTRLVQFWGRLTTWGRVLVVGAVGLALIVLLNVSGALEGGPKMRSCLKMSVEEYQKVYLDKPDDEWMDTFRRTCKRMIDNGDWR
jgi:hypothetical protein